MTAFIKKALVNENLNPFIYYLMHFKSQRAIKIYMFCTYFYDFRFSRLFLFCLTAVIRWKCVNNIYFLPCQQPCIQNKNLIWFL